MLMIFTVLAVITAIAIWLAEKVDRPLRAAARLAEQQIQPAE